MQDLIRGIQKLVAESKQRTTDSHPVNNGSTYTAAQPLIDRAFLCLEDGEFGKADNLLEQALNSDPRNASAYVGKLMCELMVKNENDLVLAAAPFEDISFFNRAIQFADDEYRRRLEGYNLSVIERLEEERIEKIYQKALTNKQKADTKEYFQKVSDLFRSISGYKDANTQAEECDELAKITQKQDTLKLIAIIISLLVIGVIFIVAVSISIN